MRALLLTAPEQCVVADVPVPVAGPGECLVDVDRVGVCGTDVEFFTGEMAYLHQGHSSYPMRLGHEWTGVVAEVGAGVDAGLVGRRVTADTMVGCGDCRRCRRGHQHVCADRYEVGIRGGRDGALAEKIVVEARSLHVLPAHMDPLVGAMVEPGGNAFKAARGAAVGPGDRALVLGPGTIGLLVAMFLRADGAEVHLMGKTRESMAFARTLGFEAVWPEGEVPDLPFDAVVDAATAAHLPALALDLVEPSGRVVYIGLAGEPSLVDTRMVALKDVTCVGVLSASGGLAQTIEAYADGVIDPTPLVAATVALEEVGRVFEGWRPPGSGAGPKVHVDPRP